MLPDKLTAIQLLEEAYLLNPGPWKAHSIVTAECAYTIAKHCEDLDPEKAYILGLLHDIGRREGVTYLAHVIDGYRYLTALDYDEAARISITHSFSIKNIHDYIGEHDVCDSDIRKICSLLENYEYNDYDLLIQLCDNIALPDGPTDMHSRTEDVRRRYGYYPQEKIDKNVEIKEYFEKKTGLDINHLTLEYE